jgi:serine/threonine-protein kinase
MSSPEPVPAEVRSPVVKGQIVDRKYRVDEVLGAGGMGIVVSAMHIALDEPVALKFMTIGQGRGDSTSRMRFLREAKAVRKLTSAHVARVFDVGQLPTGEPYIVMELLRGDDLAAYLRTRGRLTPADTVRFMLQVCDAIREAHAVGIVHRDLKPQNLFLTTRPGGGTLVKVLDFGIAKSLEATDTDPSLTTSQNVVGSPVYMSPEQLRASKHVDERTDIWSLGVIMFELLAGRVPFVADSVMELGMRIMTVPAPSLVELRKEVPEALADVVQKCLEKEPENRFATIDALAAALRPFVDVSQRSLPFADTLVEGSDRAPATDRFRTGGEFAGTKGETIRSTRAVRTWAAIAVAATAAALVTVVWPRPRATAVQEPAPSHAAPAQTSFSVRLRVTPPEAHIRFDSDAPTTSPFVSTLPIDGKPHHIVVEAEGYEPMELAFRDAPPPPELTLRKLDVPTPVAVAEPPLSPSAVLPLRKQPVRAQPLPSALPSAPAATPSAPVKTTNDAPIIR